ncbi:response regulator [Mucilaginibacter robiniae]|uniref:Response regulator n=1 Tax=Mucilaginibacter robiniae TaxID=2728022 RepID=A0A7L5DW00_9SPHI|nr:response regulator [Mucilaginibacter robiniae]QJD95275.1 response regulator [Mucilaginibacter robiniae]
MKKRILIIEDDSSILDIVTFILTEEGYDVIAAAPWPADQLHHYSADLILLDEWINEREGHLLCTELKDMHETQHIPVIILSTALNIEDIAVKCKAEGYIRKPFDIDDLVQEVENCFSGHYRESAVIR